MCWSPGQSSSVHSHGASRCHVKILRGQLDEIQVPCPRNPDEMVEVDLDRRKARLLKRDQVTYIDEELGAHWVSNSSDCEPAISLHIYLPPYHRSIVYSPIRDATSTQISQAQSRVVELQFSSYEDTIRRNITCFKPL